MISIRFRILASKTTFYLVKSGDSPSKIAKQIYGDAGRYPEIFEANRPMLSDPDKIYPGQTLRMPSWGASTGALPALNAATPVSPPLAAN